MSASAPRVLKIRDQQGGFMKITINRLALAGLAAFLAFAAPRLVSAHEDYHPHCKADLEQFCKDVKPGYGREYKCLKDHDASLSADCKAHVDKAEATHDACEGDINQFCSAEKGHPKKIHECLKAHKASLSQGCKDARHWNP
jgi:hypothetical protein